MTQKYDPAKGKWTLKSVVRREIKHHGGEMPIEDLLDYLSKRGYLKAALKRRLEALDVEVIDGWKARMRF